MFDDNTFINIPERKGKGFKKFANINKKVDKNIKKLVEEIRKETRYNGFFI